jgi:hypothetical protein
MNVQAALALLGYLIQYGPQLTEAYSEIAALITKIRTALAQSSELTPEQEAAFDQHIKDLEANPWWQVQD